jgi:hypothetical protein
MPKRRREALPDLVHGMSAEALATLTGAHISTARRWKQFKTLPPVVAKALALIHPQEGGRIEALHATWAGWRIDPSTGALQSPEGWSFTPGEVLAGRLAEARIAELDTMRRLAPREPDAEERERVEDRRAYVERVIALCGALQTATAALEHFREALSPEEADRLHWETKGRAVTERMAQEAARDAEEARTVPEPRQIAARLGRERAAERDRQGRAAEFVRQVAEWRPPEPAAD